MSVREKDLLRDVKLQKKSPRQPSNFANIMSEGNKNLALIRQGRTASGNLLQNASSAYADSQKKKYKKSKSYGKLLQNEGSLRRKHS